jgi:hypothetical protein
VPKFEKHIFVCMNQREEGHPRGCCDPTGQGELQRLFKTGLAKRGIKMVRANKSGMPRSMRTRTHRGGLPGSSLVRAR